MGRINENCPTESFCFMAGKAEHRESKVKITLLFAIKIVLTK